MSELVPHMSNAEYHASPGVSKSMLDVFSRSPHHYWWQYKSGKAPLRKETAPMRQGTIIHTAVLEPERFNEDYVVSNFKDKRSKGYKDLATEAASEGFDVLTMHEYEMAMRCRESVHKNAYANAALAEGQAELSAFTNDPENGLDVRARFDWLAPGVIVDLKTTVHAGLEFAHSVRKYRYHLQAAMYQRIAKLCGIEDCEFIFVAVERDFPYGVGVYQLSPSDMANGLTLYHELSQRLAECEQTDNWPGYTTGIETLEAYTR